MRLVVLGLAMALPSAALACPGRSATAQATTADQADASLAAVDAASCAKKAEYVGSACSYTTGMMAQRILSDGAAFTYTGTLASSNNALESHVAAPFTVAGGSVHVVANEVLDAMPTAERLTLKGKRLEVNGVEYFVVTEFETASST